MNLFPFHSIFQEIKELKSVFSFYLNTVVPSIPYRIESTFLTGSFIHSTLDTFFVASKSKTFFNALNLKKRDTTL